MSAQGGEADGGRERERARQRKREEGKRGEEKHSDETGGVGVMETLPHHCSLQEEGIQSF